jgi:hypothetical protein
LVAFYLPGEQFGDVQFSSLKIFFLNRWQARLITAAIFMPHPSSSTLSENEKDGTSCYYGFSERKGYIIAIIRRRPYLDVIANLFGQNYNVSFCRV